MRQVYRDMMDRTPRFSVGDRVWVCRYAAAAVVREVLPRTPSGAWYYRVWEVSDGYAVEPKPVTSAFCEGELEWR